MSKDSTHLVEAMAAFDARMIEDAEFMGDDGPTDCRWAFRMGWAARERIGFRATRWTFVPWVIFGVLCGWVGMLLPWMLGMVKVLK